MLQKYNKWRVLQAFFDNPLPEDGGFQLRELSRKTNLAPVSVKRYLKELLKEKMIVKSKHRVQGYPLYSADRDHEKFRFYKKLNMYSLIAETGLLDYLNNTCMPDTIILFGSAAKGEDLLESDVDIFLLCNATKLKLEPYEDKLGRKINIIFSKEFSKLSGELKNNIINGAILSGYLKVF